MLPTSLLLASIDRADQSYWLGHCEGFQVRAAGRRLGVIERLDFGSDRLWPAALHVRSGTLRLRDVVIPLDKVTRIDARRRTVFVRRAPRHQAGWAGHVPAWLTRAGHAGAP